MTPRKKSAATVLQHKKANVSIARNGVCIEVSDVPAEDAGIAAKELLDVFRTLIGAGYRELIVEATPMHSGALGEVPDDADQEEARVPVFERRVGFTQ
jgi:hypothetical protein